MQCMHNAMQCNTSGMQYNWNAMQAMHDAVEHNMMQCDTAQHNGVQQMQAMLQSTMQCYRAQHNCNTTSSDCNSESSNYGGTCNRCLKGNQSSNARGDGNHLMGRPARKLAKDEQKLGKNKTINWWQAIQAATTAQQNSSWQNAMQCNWSAMQMQKNAMEHNEPQWSTMQCKAVEHTKHKAVEHNTMQGSGAQHDTMPWSVA